MKIWLIFLFLITIKDGFATRFPSTLDVIPKKYRGPKFVISDNYPINYRDGGSYLSWEKIDPLIKPFDYMQRVRDYAFEGNKNTQWLGLSNPIRPWFHIPWMHFGEKGREFTHGLTKERTSKVGEFGPTQQRPCQTWAVALFNPTAANTINKVWRNPLSPNISRVVFDNGSVIVKLLFNECTPAENPMAKGAFEITANIHEVDNSTTRVLRKMYLMQMDLAVRDTRPSLRNKTGWVFSTLMHFPGSGRLPFDRMQMLGVQVGNDPTIGPSSNKPLEESFITNWGKKSGKLGFGGRLNGPADNPRSSCLSCHALAQVNPGKIMDSKASDGKPLVFPKEIKDENEIMKGWFQNIPAGEVVDAGFISMDYSLQLRMSIENFLINKNLIIKSVAEERKKEVKMGASKEATETIKIEGSSTGERGVSSHLNKAGD